jgi:hypothetical protein
MCGIVGVFGNLSGEDRKIFRQLLVADFFRGVHSTGMFIAKNSKASFYKRAIDPISFLEMKPVDRMVETIPFSQDSRSWSSVEKKYVDDTTSIALVGHNRHATKGAVNHVNAHPFQIGDITLVHNGTLKNQGLLPDSSDFGVDSENICHSINKIGAEDTFKKLHGAFTLVWHDAADDSLNFVRNSERPLAIANKDDKWWFASEMGMLEWILGRNGVKPDDIYELPIHTQFKYCMKSGERSKATHEFYTPPIVNYPTKYQQKKDGEESQNTHKQCLRGTSITEECVERLKGNKEKTQFLKDIGIMPGERVECYYCDYELTGKTGKLKGVLSFSPYLDTLSFGVEDDPYNLGSFSGIVVGVHLKKQLIFLRDIEWDVEDDTEVFFGPDKTLLTEKEFLQATSQGCVMCSSGVDVMDDEDIKWIGDGKEFLCPNCRDIDLEQFYVA